MTVSTSETPSERAFSRVALVSLTLAVVGVGLAIWGFVAGIDETLNGAGVIGTSIVIFYVGSSVLFVALVLAIIGLVRSESKTVPTVALAVCLIPIAAIIVIALADRR
ncbi:hypothetical protein F1C58_11125 [Glaciihabitans sp. INWT7]|uniref:hypothetical protein n=1 Tax=Glaciihabitans sp. INWT7 TaxID=2596912 RepID=UPI001623FA8C|nr:hypothetical protein [Glaciihabitans sp. INWT7]QNE47397.1 hypothetical protein F1C58_11125 [Glaciihabitans sp. INWT7]